MCSQRKNINFHENDIAQKHTHTQIIAARSIRAFNNIHIIKRAESGALFLLLHAEFMSIESVGKLK
jgi:hypothetical protein